MKTKYILLLLVLTSCKIKHKQVEKETSNSTSTVAEFSKSGSLQKENSLTNTNINEIFKSDIVEVFEYDTNKLGQPVLKRYIKKDNSAGYKTYSTEIKTDLVKKDSTDNIRTEVKTTTQKTTKVKTEKKYLGRGLMLILFLGAITFFAIRYIIKGIKR